MSAEIVLRLCGYGYATTFFKPLSIQGHPFLVDNDKFGLRFFPASMARIPAPVIMQARKPQGTIRIFIFGESAALGDPQPRYGAGRYLEALLAARFPGRHFEVLNTSMTAINSHVILPIARECARREGDIWIIYMGNNEMVGPFGAATVFGSQAPPLWLVRASLALQRTCLGQLLMAASQHLRTGSTASSWGGMEMFLHNKVPPGDPRREVVYRSFEKNLADIVRAGLDSGAKVILNTVAVNLKDCPPFASLPDATARPGERSTYDKAMAEGHKAEGEGKYLDAAALYEDASKAVPHSSASQFQWAQCLLRLTNLVAAAQHFQLACDYDALPFRADSRINHLITEVDRHFARSDLVLCDAAGQTATNSSAGIPGQESFYEHVHFNFDGNYRLAQLWAGEVERLLPPDIRENAMPKWASQEKCERLLGLTDWNRLPVVEEVIRRLKEPPLSAQSNNSERLEALQRLAAFLRERIKTDSIAETRELYKEALSRAPEGHFLHEAFAEFLEATGDNKQAIVERKTVRELAPHYYFSYFTLGTLLKAQGDLAGAKDALIQAARLNPRQGDVRIELGAVYALEKNWTSALTEFELAHQISPADPRSLLYGADALRQLNRREESIAMLREAVRLAPDYWQARYRLGETLAMQGQIAVAAEEFEKVLLANPNHVKAHANLGVALFKLGRIDEAIRQFDEALRLDPQNQQILQFRERAQASSAVSPK